MEDEQLILGCKKQDRRCQQRIYEKYAPVMYGICLRYSADAHTAQDLLHDGFMKVFSHINSYEGKGSFEGWMKRVFINMSLEVIRKGKIQKIYTEDIERVPDLENLPDQIDNSDEISESVLLGMIQTLPQGYRTVFNMYAIEDYSHKEIGQMLGIAEGTSRSQYIRARQLLQLKIKEYIKNS